MKKRKARADPKELEFSKVIMKQEMAATLDQHDRGSGVGVLLCTQQL